jgi:hypothetical protein
MEPNTVTLYLAEFTIGAGILAYLGYKSLDYFPCFKGAVCEAALKDSPHTRTKLLLSALKRLDSHITAYQELGENSYPDWVSQRL